MKGARFRSLPENAKPGSASPIRSQAASVGAPLCGAAHPLDPEPGGPRRFGGGGGGTTSRAALGAGVAAGVGAGVAAGGDGAGLGFTFTPMFCSRRSMFVSVSSPLNHIRVVCTEKSPVSFGNIWMRELRLTPAGTFWNVMLHKAVQASVISAEFTDQPFGTSMTM